MATNCKHRTARISHAQTFSRVWLKLEFTLHRSHGFVVIRKIVISTRTDHVSRAIIFAWLPASSTSARRTFLTFSLARETSTAIHAPVDSLAALPNKVPSQVMMSSTILSRCAVRRLRLCSYQQEERVLGRLFFLARTLPLHLRLRKRMKDRVWECWFHRCTRRRERHMQAHQERIYHSYKQNSSSGSSPIPSSTGKLVAT